MPVNVPSPRYRSIGLRMDMKKESWEISITGIKGYAGSTGKTMF